MLNLDEILESKTQTNAGGDKTTELINRVHLLLDDKLDQLTGIVDVQGTDLIKCIVYVTAIEKLLIDLGLVTEDKFKSYLQAASDKIKEEFLRQEPPATADSAADIEI